MLKNEDREFLGVQWLGLHASIAGSMGLKPDWEPKIPQKQPKRQNIKTEAVLQQI